MIQFIPLLLLISVSCSSLQIKPASQSDFTARATASESEVYSQTDYQAVLEGLAPYVKKLERPTYFYSWCENCMKDSSEKTLRAGVEYKTSNFFRLDKRDSGMLGNGMYLALDPVISRSYGGKDDSWNLIVMKVAAGTTYVVDPVGHEKRTDMRNYSPIFENLGCKTEDPPSMNVNVLRFLEVPSEACRKLKFKVFKDLNIKAIFYHWSATPTAACLKRPQYAVVAVDAGIFDFKNSFVLKPESTSTNKKGAALVNNFFDEASKNALFPVWSKLSDQEYEKTQREHFFGCRGIESENLPEKQP